MLKLAWQSYRAGDFGGAAGLIARALTRDGFNPQVHYASGVIYRAAQRSTVAQDAFWAAIRYGSPPAPALAQLGEISIQQKKYDEAAGLLRQALSYNPNDALALTDLAVALRRGGKLQQAGQAADEALRKAPLLPFALAEQWRIEEARGKAAASPAPAKSNWAAPLPADAQDYLEIAAWYRSLADLASSDAVLQAAVKNLPAEGLSSLVYYYLAFNARQQGKDRQAEEYGAKAEAASCARVFPYRLEDARALNDALLRNPLDTHAQYLLGNLLFARGRYEDAARVWSRALGQGFEYSVLMRNLGLYAWRVKKDLTGAGGFYDSAIRLAPDDYRLYVDLDEIYFQSGNIAGREKLFAQAPAAVRNRDTVLVRLALLHTQKRHYDQALELLMNHRFKPWEGGAIVREMFVLANIEKGKQALEAKNPSEAESAFRRALEYPASLGVGKPDKPHDEEALFWLGEALAAQGKTDAAHDAWQQAVEQGKKGASAARLFRGLALRRLGQTEEADQILKGLAQATAQPSASGEDFFVAGQLNLIENYREEAKRYFLRALELDPSLWQARIELGEIGS